MKQTLLTLFLSIFLIGLANAQVTSSSHGLIAQHQTVGKGKLAIYPNPASDYIQLTDTDEVAQIIIYNVVGKRMKTYEFVEDKKYSVIDLPNGLYLIQFVGINSKIISTQRLSKR